MVTVRDKNNNRHYFIEGGIGPKKTFYLPRQIVRHAQNTPGVIKSSFTYIIIVARHNMI